MPNLGPTDLRVAIAGLGPIGKRVAEALDRGIDGMVLAAVSAQNPEKHRSWLGNLATTPAVLPIEKLVDAADIVIECAPSKLIRSIVSPFVTSGKTAIVLSAGALLENEDLIELAKQNGGQIEGPTGALIGLDAVPAAAGGHTHGHRLSSQAACITARRDLNKHARNLASCSSIKQPLADFGAFIRPSDLPCFGTPRSRFMLGVWNVLSKASAFLDDCRNGNGRSRLLQRVCIIGCGR